MRDAASTTQTTTQHLLEPDGELVHRLTLVHGSAESPSLYLTGESITIGREHGAGVWQVSDPDVSRRHTKITFAADYGSYRVKDLDSKNGTFVDGRRITNTEVLKNGSVIGVGHSLMVYEAVKRDPRVEGINDCPRGVSLARYQAEVLVDIAAAHDGIAIMILGPTGSGKDVLAQRVHDKSKRPGKMVPINCATLNKELIGSELFGHKKGSYSGAEQERAGLFLSATGGTLFLDEIAELPLDQQASLLRVLEERKVRPVGSDVEVPVDVRLICATHQDLGRLEQEGRFRADLLARLEGLTVRLPPLAERRVEIIPLFESFLDREIPLAFAAAQALLLHSWPKNIRELMKAAKQVELFGGRTEQIDVWLLDSSIQRTLREVTASADTERPTREVLAELLRKYKGNVTHVAQELERQRNQIYRWMDGYDLKANDFRAE